MTYLKPEASDIRTKMDGQYYVSYDGLLYLHKDGIIKHGAFKDGYFLTKKDAYKAIIKHYKMLMDTDL